MLELTTFVISDGSEKPSPDKLKLLNPRNVLVLQFIPSSFSFSVTFGILGMQAGENKVSYRLLSENGEEIASTGELNIIQKQEDGLPESANNIMINFDIRNVPFSQEGIYISEVKVNDRIIGERKLFVVKSRNGSVQNGH